MNEAAVKPDSGAKVPGAGRASTTPAGDSVPATVPAEDTSVDSDEFQEFESYQPQSDDVTNHHDDVSSANSSGNEARNTEGKELMKFVNSKV